MSISGAARELGVTPSAVSQQLRVLEDNLGVSLVERNARGFELTQYGQRLFPAFVQGFDLIARACREIKESDVSLAISTLPSFATKWLNPRLKTFSSQHKEFHLYISTSLSLVDFSKESFDLAIRYGQGKYPNLVCDLLFNEYFTPAVAPSLAGEYRSMLLSGQTRDMVFLCDAGMEAGERVTWPIWFAQRGQAFATSNRRIVYNDANMTIDAAIDGYGLLLGRRTLIDDIVAAGKLVYLDPEPMDFGLAYYLVFPSLAGLSSAARAFRTWLLSCAQAERARRVETLRDGALVTYRNT